MLLALNSHPGPIPPFETTHRQMLFAVVLFMATLRKGNVSFSFSVFNSQDPFGVALGGTLGHCLCTGLAVIGGRMIAQKISVRTGEIWSSVHR